MVTANLQNSSLPRADAAERRVLLLMDHSLEFVEVVGAQGVIKGVSAAIKPLAGYDPGELEGCHCQDLLHPDDYESAATQFARVLRGEACAPIRIRYRRKDGTWRTLRASARNFLDDPGVRAIVVLTRDVTGQIDAENSVTRALIDAQERERRCIAGELHEDVQQILVGLRLHMEAAMRKAPPLVPGESLGIWIAHVKEVIEHLHELTQRLRAQPTAPPPVS